MSSRLCGTPLAYRSVGAGQTFQNVTASRVAGTSYQNTSGRTIQVFVGFTANGNAVSDDVTATLQTSPDNVTFTTVALARHMEGGTGRTSQDWVGAPIPPNYYYRCNFSESAEDYWVELT